MGGGGGVRRYWRWPSAWPSGLVRELNTGIDKIRLPLLENQLSFGKLFHFLINCALIKIKGRTEGNGWCRSNGSSSAWPPLWKDARVRPFPLLFLQTRWEYTEVYSMCLTCTVRTTYTPCPTICALSSPPTHEDKSSLLPPHPNPPQMNTSSADVRHQGSRGQSLATTAVSRGRICQLQPRITDTLTKYSPCDPLLKGLIWFIKAGVVCLYFYWLW